MNVMPFQLRGVLAPKQPRVIVQPLGQPSRSWRWLARLRHQQVGCESPSISSRVSTTSRHQQSPSAWLRAGPRDGPTLYQSRGRADLPANEPHHLLIRESVRADGVDSQVAHPGRSSQPRAWLCHRRRSAAPCSRRSRVSDGPETSCSIHAMLLIRMSSLPKMKVGLRIAYDSPDSMSASLHDRLAPKVWQRRVLGRVGYADDGRRAGRPLFWRRRTASATVSTTRSCVMSL